VPTTSGAEDEDPVRLSRAYNNSIYLMVGMPYLLLGVVGFLIYRGVRQRDRMQRAAADAARPSPRVSGERGYGESGDGSQLTQGVGSCSLPSTDGAS
jgi:hypothetical protein